MSGCGANGQVCGVDPLCTAVPGERELVSIVWEIFGIGVSKVTEVTEKARAGFRENSQ